MHILVTADTVGGVWTYTRELVTGLIGRGITVTLVSFGGLPTAEQTLWMNRLHGLQYFPTRFKLEWMQNSESDLACSAEYLTKVIYDVRPDLLHLNQFYYGALECDLPRLVVAHSDVVSWWLAVQQEEPPSSPWIRWYREVVTHGLAAATAVVAPSRWMLDQIYRNYVRPEIAKVVYNGRNPEFFAPHLKKDDLVVTVGRQWDRAKNAALLLQRELPVPVCIVGSDRHPESDGKAFGQNPAGTTVQFTGQQSEQQLSRLLARTSIYAATSCYEPFGLAPVEAALSGCALVAADIPSFRELWDGAAVFFRNGDADSLHNAVNALLEDPQERRRFARLALSRAQERFSAARMIDEILVLYRGLANVRAVPA